MKKTIVRQPVIFPFLIIVKQDDKLKRKRKHLLSAIHSLRAASNVAGWKEKNIKTYQHSCVTRCDISDRFE